MYILSFEAKMVFPFSHFLPFLHTSLLCGFLSLSFPADLFSLECLSALLSEALLRSFFFVPSQTLFLCMSHLGAFQSAPSGSVFSSQFESASKIRHFDI